MGEIFQIIKVYKKDIKFKKIKSKSNRAPE